MSKAATSMIAVVVTAILTGALIHQRREEARLVAENHSLHQQLGPLRQLTLENIRLSNLVALSRSSQTRVNDQLRELLRLRTEINTLRQRTNMTVATRAAKADRKSDASRPAADAETDSTASIARGEWAFAGYATPEAAYQSVAWAMSNGDVQAYLASVTPDGLRFLEQQFEGKTETEIATLLKDEISAARELRFDRKRDSGDGKITFVLSSKEQDDGQVKTKDEQVVVFKKIGEEWRLTAGPDE